MQEDHTFMAILGYKERCCLERKKNISRKVGGPNKQLNCAFGEGNIHQIQYTLLCNKATLGLKCEKSPECRKVLAPIIHRACILVFTTVMGLRLRTLPIPGKYSWLRYVPSPSLRAPSKSYSGVITSDFADLFDLLLAYSLQ